MNRKARKKNNTDGTSDAQISFSGNHQLSELKSILDFKAKIVSDLLRRLKQINWALWTHMHTMRMHIVEKIRVFLRGNEGTGDLIGS